MLLNACAVGFTVWELMGSNWVTGLLGGGLLLNETFMKGNLERNVSRVDEVNKRNIKDFSRSLEEYFNNK